MTDTEAWYIVKQSEGHCEIVPANSIESGAIAKSGSPDQGVAEELRWGPYASQSEAIARRVGLIRAGKCQPV
jgi:hypothetical protein